MRLARAVEPTTEDDRQAQVQALFNAARIYALAVTFAAKEVSRQGERGVVPTAVIASRALELLEEALKQVPDAVRREEILNDPALRPLRRVPSRGPKRAVDQRSLTYRSRPVSLAFNRSPGLNGLHETTSICERSRRGGDVSAGDPRPFLPVPGPATGPVLTSWKTARCCPPSGQHNGRQRPGLAAAGDPGFQRAAGSSNTIDFDIPGQGVQTIAPLSPLPTITNSMLIDGFSQPGYAGTPLIELSGLSAGALDGLTITGSDVTVRGLAINSFSQGSGILITGTGASGNVIAANDIGTDPSGSLALPNDFGIRILAGAHDNLVGGSTAAAGNLITNNLGPGVSVEGNPSVGNRITANQIFANDVPPTPTPAGMLQFDGSSYVRLPGDLLDLYNAISRTVTQTIEAWFQTTSGGVILGASDFEPIHESDCMGRRWCTSAATAGCTPASLE